MPGKDKSIQIAVYFSDKEEEKTARQALDEVIDEFDGVIIGKLGRGKLKKLAKARLSFELDDSGPKKQAPVPTKTRGEKRAVKYSRVLTSDMQEKMRDFNLLARHVEQMPNKRGFILSPGEVAYDPDIHGFDELYAAAADLDPLEEDVYEVTFNSPINQEIKTKLAKLGLDICSYVPPDTYRLFMNAAQLEKIRKMPFVKDIRRYTIVDTVTPEILNQEKTEGEKAFDLVLHRAIDLEKVRTIIENTEGTRVTDTAERMIRFYCAPGSPILPALANLPQVMSITPYQPPSLFCDWTRKFLGIDRLSRADGWNLTGRGQIVAIFDSGIDDQHPDLTNRIDRIEAELGAEANDLFGHGTHVAGIIAGNGTVSNGAITGMAPEAKLVSIGILDANGEFQLPLDLGKLLQKAVDAGAAIINLSWGFSFQGGYVHGSMTIDQFVYNHPDVLVVVAAGNAGKAPQGFHALKTVGAPATAKNVLTVGACGVDRDQFQGKNWGTIDPGDFPMPPASQETILSDLVAGPSSRGPTDYDSIKPDIVAPGYYLLSTRAKDAPRDRFLEIYPAFDDHYAFLGGTSMATPVVSGVAALIRQYLQEHLDIPRPSANLLKAILIATANPLTPRDQPAGLAEKIGYPDFDMGFGRLDLTHLFPFDTGPNQARPQVIDIANDSPDALASRMPVGSGRRSFNKYQFTREADQTAPLRFVLTWTDVPGSGVQNNLGLEIKGPAGLLWHGNGQHVYLRDPLLDNLISTGSERFDKRNNVEQVLIQEPQPGEYEVRVRALNTPFPPQGYALCVLGTTHKT